LSEYRRMCRWEGIIRITEPELIPTTSSPAQLQLKEVFLQAFFQAGHPFTLANDGVISALERLLRQQGLQDVQTRDSVLAFTSDNLEGQRFIDDVKMICRTSAPFLRKWTKVPDDYEQRYQQMLLEMQQPDFTATWTLRTAWGKV
jgi:hypothetical protein